MVTLFVYYGVGLVYRNDEITINALNGNTDKERIDVQYAQDMREELVRECWMVTVSGPTNLELQYLHETYNGNKKCTRFDPMRS